MDSAQHDRERQPTGAGRAAPQRQADLVLAVLRGKKTLVESASEAGATEAELSRWIEHFIETGLSGLRHGGRTPAALGAGELTARSDDLRNRLGRLRDEARGWRESAGDRLGPLRELEAIRLAEEMSISRFCALLRIPRRSYCRRLSLLRAGEPGRKGRPAPCMESCASIVSSYMAMWPEYGHRKLRALMAADGHVTSPSTVLRAMRLLRRLERGAATEPREPEPWRNR